MGGPLSLNAINWTIVLLDSIGIPRQTEEGRRGDSRSLSVQKMWHEGDRQNWSLASLQGEGKQESHMETSPAALQQRWQRQRWHHPLTLGTG